MLSHKSNLFLFVWAATVALIADAAVLLPWPRLGREPRYVSVLYGPVTIIDVIPIASGSTETQRCKVTRYRTPCACLRLVDRTVYILDHLASPLMWPNSTSSFIIFIDR